MDICIYCSSSDVVDTNENITCISCSKVQPFQFLKTEHNSCFTSSKSSDFVQEFQSRYGLTLKEVERVNERLEYMKMRKSAFTKIEISLALIYLGKIQNKSHMSLHAFCSYTGDLTSTKRLNMCYRYVLNILNLKLDSVSADWDNVITPYSDFFKILKKVHLQQIISICENMTKVSNLSIFSICATCILGFLIKVRSQNKEAAVSEVSSYSKISKATLSKNFNKYKEIISFRFV